MKLRCSFESLFFILFLLLSLSSCEKYFTDYGEDKIPEGFEKVGSQTITSAGGKIDLSGISIEIPTGAFDESNQITILKDVDSHGFDGHAISDVFMIQGLPSSLNSQIKVSIPLNGKSIRGDTLMLTGSTGYCISDSDTTFGMEPCEADLVGDELQLLYPPTQNGFGSLKTNVMDYIPTQLLVTALSGYTNIESSGRHFRIFVPLSYEIQGKKLAEYFEVAYDTCKKIGFDMSPRTTQAKVFVAQLPQRAGGYIQRGFVGITDHELKELVNAGMFDVNIDYINNDNFLKIVAGHEMLHMVQNCYEFSAPWIKPEQMWLIEASATWFEEKFSNKPNYLSHNQIRFLHDVSGGLQQSYSPPFGYCHSFIIKDLYWNKGNQGIVDLFKKIKDGKLPDNPTDPIDALKKLIQDPLDLYWHAVAGAYFLGHYYDKQLALPAIDTLYKWNQANSLDKNLPYGSLDNPLQDLSAKLLIFDLNDSGWGTGDHVVFKVTEPSTTGLVVFKYKRSKEITLVNEVNPGQGGQVVVENLDDLYNSGYSLGVVITNCNTSLDFKEVKNINIEIEINAGDIGSETKILLPEKIDMKYWIHRSNWASDDTVFMLKIVNPPTQKSPEFYRRDIYDTDYWLDFDYQSDLENYAVTYNTLTMMTHFLPPDTTFQLKFRIVLDDNSEVHESISLTTSEFFDGVTMDIDESNYYPFNEFTPYQLQGTCVYPMMKLSIIGNTLNGTIDKQNYYCENRYGGEIDSSKVFSTKCSFSITFGSHTVNGSHHFEHSAKFTSRDTISQNNSADEYEFSETYTFSSPFDILYDVSASNYYSQDPDYYSFDVNHKDIIGDYNWKKVYHMIGRADSIVTESKSFESDQYRSYPIYFSAYIK